MQEGCCLTAATFVRGVVHEYEKKALDCIYVKWVGQANGEF